VIIKPEIGKFKMATLIDDEKSVRVDVTPVETDDFFVGKALNNLL
jgi:hypothetical protein